MPELPRNLKRRTWASKSSGRTPGSSSCEERAPDVDAAHYDAGVDLGPVVEDDAGRPVARRRQLHAGNARVRADLRTEGLGSAGDGCGDRAGPALVQAPGSEGPVDLAHVVVEQDVGRARRADAEERADDARRGHRGLERIGLEPLVQEVGGAHRHQADERRLVALRQPGEVAGQPQHAQPVARVQAGDVRRDHAEDRLDEAGHLRHEEAVFLVGVGVGRRPATDLAHGRGVVVAPPQPVAVERRERAVERQDLQAVLRELKVADDLRAQQADDVRKHAERVAGHHLVAGHGAAQEVALLEGQDLPAGLRQVGGGREPVVAAADDHRVVAIRHPDGLLRLGLSRVVRCLARPPGGR